MAVNALRKKGAKMSLQEALERVEKLKKLAQSSNQHEAALATLRLKSFDVNAARAPRSETDLSEDPSENKNVEVLQELPDRPYQEIGVLEVQQAPQKTGVNWEELHFELLNKARKISADAMVNFQLKGTPNQKILAGTALKYLTPQEILELQQQTKLVDEEKVLLMAQKERRDEDTAPGIG